MSNGAHVSEASFVAPTAAVCGSAYITNSRLLGDTVVKDNAYVENSTLMGNTIIEGDASVSSSTLRGFHHFSTGNIDGLKAFKKQSATQKSANRSATLATLQNQKKSITRQINEIEGREIAIVANQFHDNIESYSFATLREWANRKGGSFGSHSNPAAYYTSSGISTFERYKREIERLEGELRSIDAQIRAL